MKMSKRGILAFKLISLIVGIILVVILGIKSHEMHLQLEFEKFIEEDNLSLTIYYINPFVRLRYPMSDTNLMNGAYEHKVTVPSSKLKEHTDLLNQINNVTLRPVVFKPYQDTRLLYIFETKIGEKILSVSMQGGYGYMYINGNGVKANSLFYEVVMPFLPDDAVKELRRLLKET